MSDPYAEYSTKDLLEALQWAGRHPDIDLIKECLDRPDDLTPHLLDILDDPEESEYWQDDDPRWYEPVHAGKLLLAYREPEALPLFADIIQDTTGDRLIEWFDTDLHAFGPVAVPTYVDLVQDDATPSLGRSLTVSALRQIAHDHPETREQVLTALRAELPPVGPDGQPKPDVSPSEDRTYHWTTVAMALAELGDEQSQSRIEALFAEDLLDEMVMGDHEDYSDILSGKSPPINYDFDPVSQYSRRRAFEEDFESRTSTATSHPTNVQVLVENLVQSGRRPHPDLIRDCVAALDELAPALLSILRADIQADTREKDWDSDDPRWYRMIHAGHLLFHIRHEEALPLFIDEYRLATADSFNEWFTDKMRLYGPTAVEPLTDLLHDEDAGVWSRIEAAGELSHIGWAHPDTRAEVLAALRDVLPPFTDGDAPVVPDETTDDRSLLWTNVTYELARHRDETSRSQIEALFAHDLIDLSTFGDLDEYHRLLRGEAGPSAEFEPASFDVIEHYERLYQQEQRKAQREAAQKRREETQRSQAGQNKNKDGTYVRDQPKVGRNDPCPCGSGVKYKYCCG